MESSEIWRVALESVGDALIAADQNGVVTYLNRAAESLCGWSKHDALGKPAHDVLSVRDQFSRQPIAVLADPVDSGVPYRGRHGILVRRDQTEIPVEVTASPILDSTATIAGVVAVLRDSSQSREDKLVRERLAAIIESSDDMIVSKTLDGIITTWNEGAERLLGYRADEVIGRHVSMLMPPEAAEDTERILGKIRRGEKVDHYLTKRKHKDGRVIEVSLSVSPIRDADGAIVGASKVGRDVSVVSQAKELRERLAAIVESSEDIIVSKNLDGVITSWNKGAEHVLGYSAAEMIGRHVSSIMPADVVEDTHKILSRVKKGQRVEHYETRRVRKDGRIIDVSLTVSPIHDASGRIIGASKIGRDITQQKAVEAERKEADRRKDEFLAMLAHELRNPLASISNAIQLFGKLESEAELEWAKAVVNRQVKHLARLIDDLLDVSRITRGKISLRKEIVDLSPIVSSAVEAVRPLIEERKHELIVGLAPGALQLAADPVRLEQILINLLTNAAKYTEAGGQITLSAGREKNQIVIKVKDTGLGIPPELMPKLFELFVQGDRSIARSEGGLGIGLTLVKSLAEMHGGEIKAESEGAGKGSVFTLRLPAAELTSVESRVGRPLPRMTRQHSRVLVVDDNVDTAGGLAKLLKLLGHEVKVVHDGEAALATAREMKPDVVLLDIGLPGIDGYEVVRQLRREPGTASALIIAISGYGQDEDRRKSQAAGFDHHLIKPIDFDSLLSLMA